MQAWLHSQWANVGGMDVGKATQLMGQSGGYGCWQGYTGIVPILGGIYVGKASQPVRQSEGYGCRQWANLGVWMQARLHRNWVNVREMDAGNTTQALSLCEGYGCRQGYTGIGPM